MKCQFIPFLTLLFLFQTSSASASQRRSSTYDSTLERALISPVANGAASHGISIDDFEMLGSPVANSPDGCISIGTTNPAGSPQLLGLPEIIDSAEGARSPELTASPEAAMSPDLVPLSTLVDELQNDSESGTRYSLESDSVSGAEGSLSTSGSQSVSLSEMLHADHHQDEMSFQQLVLAYLASDDFDELFFLSDLDGLEDLQFMLEQVMESVSVHPRKQELIEKLNREINQRFESSSECPEAMPVSSDESFVWGREHVPPTKLFGSPFTRAEVMPAV